MNELLICAIHCAELTSVVGDPAGLETNVEAVTTTNADSDGKIALTVHKKILAGNIQLSDLNRRSSRIEKRDFGSDRLPNRHRAKNDDAGRDTKRTCS